MVDVLDRAEERERLGAEFKRLSLSHEEQHTGTAGAMVDVSA
jgi:hypothetical protein